MATAPTPVPPADDDDHHAQHTADRARFRALTAPLTLYAGAPAPDHVPGVAALAQAYAHFRAHYRPDDPEHRLILDGALRAFTALQERPWTVLPDGMLEIVGSQGDSIYQVNDAACRQKGRTTTDRRSGRTEPALCPSFRFAQRRHGGACYHVIARELLRLAQLFERPAPTLADAPPAEPYLPYVTLPGRLLGLALGIAHLPTQTVTLALDAPLLTLTVGDVAALHRIQLAGSTGQGGATVQVSAGAFASLWHAFRPVATSLPLVTLFIDLADGLVLISGDTFSVEAQGLLVK